MIRSGLHQDGEIMLRIGSLWRSTFVHYKRHGACVVQEHVGFQVLSIEPSPRSPESLQRTTTFFSCAGGRQGVQLFAERSRSDASNMHFCTLKTLKATLQKCPQTHLVLRTPQKLAIQTQKGSSYYRNHTFVCILGNKPYTKG